MTHMDQVILDVESTVQALEEPGLGKELERGLLGREIRVLSQRMRDRMLLVAEQTQWWERERRWKMRSGWSRHG